MKNKKIHLLLLGVVVLGAFLRFYKIGETSFDRDEFFELNSSYGYHKTGEWLAWDFGKGKPLDPELQDDTSNERAEVFRMQLAQIYNFAEPSEGLTRSVGAVWGILSIILVYLVTVSMTGSRWVALIAAFLTAVGYSEVLYSRRLRMYAMLFPAYLFFTWTVFKFYESKYRGKIGFFSKVYEKTGFNPSYFLPVIIAGLVSYNVHMLSIHMVVAVAAYSFIGLLPVVDSFYRKNISVRQFFLNKYFLTIAVGLSGPIVYSMPFFDSLHTTVKKNFRFILSEPNYDFFKQYFSDFSHVWIGTVLVLLGTWYLCNKLERKKEALFIFLSFAAPLAVAIFTWRRDVSHRYIYFIQPFGIMLSAVGMYAIIFFVTKKIGNMQRKTVVVTATFALLLLGLNFKYITSKNSEVYVQSKAYPDFKPVFDYVIKNRKPEDVMITRIYRSFYWKGEDVEVFDFKSYVTGSKGCEKKVKSIVEENKSGWVVFPKIDNIVVCAAAREYFKNNLTKVEDKSIPSSVGVYRWE